MGPYIFTVVNIKKSPAIPIVLHTTWARALSAIVIVFPLTIRMHTSQKKIIIAIRVTHIKRILEILIRLYTQQE